MWLEPAPSGIFLDRTLLKYWTHGRATQRAHLELGNPLFEEELGNFSKLSVFSPVLLYCPVVIKTRESQCLVPFIYLYNKYSLHLSFPQDTP